MGTRQSRPRQDVPPTPEQVGARQFSLDGDDEYFKGFICPISLGLMTDPVSIATGHVFDRVSIAIWFERGRFTDPLTNERLMSLELTPKSALKDAIETYLQNRPVEERVLTHLSDNEVKTILYRDTYQFLRELEVHMKTEPMRAILAPHGINESAAKSYVATILGLVRKNELGLLFMPATEDIFCIPESLVPFISKFIFSHLELVRLIRQKPELFKTALEASLNRGEIIPTTVVHNEDLNNEARGGPRI